MTAPKAIQVTKEFDRRVRPTFPGVFFLILILLFGGLWFAPYHSDLTGFHRQTSSPMNRLAEAPPPITRAVAEQSVVHQATELSELCRSLSLNSSLQHFVTDPDRHLFATSFSDQNLLHLQLDLVVICNRKLQPMSYLAYDRIRQAPTHVDPEVKLGLINHPLFLQKDDPTLVFLRTSRGTMLLADQPILAPTTQKVTGHLILGRILAPEMLGGAHFVTPTQPDSLHRTLWPDIFGQPVFAVN